VAEATQFDGENDKEDPALLTGSVMNEMEYLRDMDDVVNNRAKATMLGQRLRLLTHIGHDHRAFGAYRIEKGFKKELVGHFDSVHEAFFGCSAALALSKEKRMGWWYLRSPCESSDGSRIMRN
jgi:hypothetical protein